MTQFPRVRDVLNRLKWNEKLDQSILLLVRDRVTGVKEIRGDQIRRIIKRSFETDESTIPFYKVTRIWKDGVAIWMRPGT